MSLAVSRSEGVTVLTLTSDTSSMCPPLCQLLGALCYSPGLCSVSRRLPSVRGGPQAALGALWIISGVMHIGLGVILMTTRGTEVYMLRDTYCPVWLGVLSMLFGVSCIVSERKARPVFALINVLLNLTGAALSITGIVWYSAGGRGFYEFCLRDRSYDYDWRHRHRTTTTTALPDQSALLERCEEARDLLRQLTLALRVTLITLSVLGLCLSLSSSIISIKTLRKGQGHAKATKATE